MQLKRSGKFVFHFVILIPSESNIMLFLAKCLKKIWRKFVQCNKCIIYNQDNFALLMFLTHTFTAHELPTSTVDRHTHISNNYRKANSVQISTLIIVNQNNSVHIMLKNTDIHSMSDKKLNYTTIQKFVRLSTNFCRKIILLLRRRGQIPSMPQHFKILK